MSTYSYVLFCPRLFPYVLFPSFEKSVSHPYKAGVIIVLYILSFNFYIADEETKDSELAGSQQSGDLMWPCCK